MPGRPGVGERSLNAIDRASQDDRRRYEGRCEALPSSLAGPGGRDDDLNVEIVDAGEIYAIHHAGGSDIAHGAIINGIIARVKLERPGRSTTVFLHEKVAGEIRRAIADGEARPGDRLPPARDLAAVMGVNTNTVLRALRMLRDEGLLDFRRGRGIHVAGSLERSAVIDKARAFLDFATRNGYRREEIIQLIRDLP